MISGPFGLFICDTSVKRLAHPHGVPCVYAKEVLLHACPGCQPITLEQAWRDAGLRNEPWVVCSSTPDREEKTVFLNDAVFVFTTRQSAADRAAHLNRQFGGSNWIARTLREHLAQIRLRVGRAADLFGAADSACASLIAELPATESEVRDAS